MLWLRISYPQNRIYLLELLSNVWHSSAMRLCHVGKIHKTEQAVTTVSVTSKNEKDTYRFSRSPVRDSEAMSECHLEIHVFLATLMMDTSLAKRFYLLTEPAKAHARRVDCVNRGLIRINLVGSYYQGDGRENLILKRLAGAISARWIPLVWVVQCRIE